MYNFNFYLPIKIVTVGFEENRIDVVMYWRLIVDITHNAIDIYKRHVFRTTCSTHKSNAWLNVRAQRIKAVILMGDWLMSTCVY